MTVLTSTPSWLSSLTTATIATDMTSAVADGTLTYTELKTVLTDFSSMLTSTSTTVTLSELTDLQTIVINLNNGVTTSAYLTGIMSSLVLGDTMNATWTGGAATSVLLGNLATGFTATKFNELIGKWFLGTDLPSSKVYMDGSFSVSYSASFSPVFGTHGPSASDVNQGYLGDCYLLACLAEVAYQNPSLISSMITDNGNNTYGVRFYVDGTAKYVTVNNSLAYGGSIFNEGTNIWASLIEKAYAQLQAGGVTTGNPWYGYGNSWSSIGNGGAPENALAEITGATQITDYYGNGSTWYTVVYDASINWTSYVPSTSNAAVLNALIADLAEGDNVVLSSWTNAKDSSGKITLVSGHAMSIYGYDAATGMLQVRNPWGSMNGQYWATTFEVSLSTLLAAGDVISVDNTGTGSAADTGGAAPTVTHQTDTQTWRRGVTVNFTLPSDTFTDPDGDLFTYSARLATGAKLPSWLKFNSVAGTFTGKVPVTANGLSIVVTATDTTGMSTSETFSVLTPASPPALNIQTSNQTWKAGKSFKLALSSKTFIDPDGQKLTYMATLADGSALPSWLKFTGKTETFSGKAPKTATTLSLKVTATDTSGLSASEIFTATITTAAAKLTHAIASMNSGTGLAATSLTHLASDTAPRLATPLHRW